MFVRSLKLYRVRYIIREPTELDATLENPVATLTKLYEAYTRAEAWEAARQEMQLSLVDACRRTPQGVPTLSVEEL